MLTTSALIHIGASAALFLLVWNVLGRGLLKPFFDLVIEREAKTTGSETLAGHKREELRALEANVRTAQQEARLHGLARRDELVSHAKVQAQGTRESAVESAQRELAKAKAELAQLRARSETEIEAEVERISAQIIQRVLVKSAERTIH